MLEIGQWISKKVHYIAYKLINLLSNKIFYFQERLWTEEAKKIVW